MAFLFIIKTVWSYLVLRSLHNDIKNDFNPQILIKMTNKWLSKHRNLIVKTWPEKIERFYQINYLQKLLGLNANAVPLVVPEFLYIIKTGIKKNAFNHGVPEAIRRVIEENPHAFNKEAKKEGIFFYGTTKKDNTAIIFLERENYFTDTMKYTTAIQLRRKILKANQQKFIEIEYINYVKEAEKMRLQNVTLSPHDYVRSFLKDYLQ